MKTIALLSTLLLAGCAVQFGIGPYHRDPIVDVGRPGRPGPGIGLPGPPGPPGGPTEPAPVPGTNNVYSVVCPVCMSTYTMHPTSDYITGGVNLGITNSMQVSDQYHSLTFTCLLGHSFSSAAKTTALSPIAYPLK